MRKRRQIVAGLIIIFVLGAAGLGLLLREKPEAPPPPTLAPPQFVSAANGQFWLAGEPYHFIGANFWQGMNLGVAGVEGNRERLAAELDKLQQLGVTNLRIMAASEGPDTEPYRMKPALMVEPLVYNERVLDGLDHLLYQMSLRGMRAVMVLNNYWQWSGGMAQYVSWQEETPIPYPGDWGDFMAYSAKFYTCAACQAVYRQHIEKLISHKNPYTGLQYRDDPTIFAWELANEPRRYPIEWIGEMATYIKTLDPNHLVTTGSEGAPPGEQMDFRRTHASPAIDYTTAHIWPQNWGWYDPKRPETYETAEKQALDYLRTLAVESAALGKPLVLEEFGLARDMNPSGNIYDPAAATTTRDRFYTALFEAVLASVTKGGPIAGANFWAWSGQARPGDPWVGDPPHEVAGWYGVYDSDTNTLAIISAFAEAIAVQSAK